MHDKLIEAVYKASRQEGRPISKEHAEFICEDYFSSRDEAGRLREALENLLGELPVKSGNEMLNSLVEQAHIALGQNRANDK